MFKITIEGKELFLDSKKKVLELFDNSNKEVICCLVNNRLRELNYEVGYDADIKLLKLDNSQAVNVYAQSLRYLFAMAVNNIYPDVNFKFSYNVSRSFLAKVVYSEKNPKFTVEMMNKIEEEMKRIISLDMDIERAVLSNAEAEVLYRTLGYIDKIDILKYRPEKTVHLNRCGSYLNYVYGHQVPSTGYLNKFKLEFDDNGILLRYPRAEKKGEIPEFEKEETYRDALKDAYKWAKSIHAENIAHINENIEDEVSKIDFVNTCEARHNADLVYLANTIIDHIDDLRLICIAGPSSSGKTTFSNRLRIQLMTRGINPVKISIDDYYIDRKNLVIKPGEKIDLEDINIIDIKLLNEHLKALIEGKHVTLPTFDFKTGSRGVGRTISVNKDQPIIIEGIHALNDDLTPLISKKNKYKIYIAPHVQVNIDNHTPISSTNIRLLRRIVRDYQYRGYSAENTLAQWDSVRAGEFKWIYKNEEAADFVYNSDLVYEVAVLKKHAEKLLKTIPVDSPYYVKANSILKFLKLYKDIEDELVPCNSLLREFIGGSCFKNV